MKWIIIKNPRKPNGDLGDIKCEFCGVSTGAYLTLPENGGLICKGCLLNAIDDINKVILMDGETIWNNMFDDHEVDEETVKIISSF